MCGINGIIFFKGQEVDPASLNRMGNQMVHRGPDDEGLWFEKNAGLGFRRLSIIDVENAQQPICNEDSTLVLVCNGEIYNYLELREKLISLGHQFKTNGDAETILHLYEEYGTDCVDHLRGMFSFMIWDTKKEMLFAARDHFGIKPFYYSYNKEKLICSSELKSVIQDMDGTKEVDQQSLLQYLTFQYVPEPRTMVAGVFKLPPGHRLIVKGSDIQVERYWQPEFKPMEQSEKEMREDIRSTLEESVKLHMQSDVPFGSFLSSGIDSTAIASLMRQQGPLKTFSIGFAGKQNECEIARQTAEMLRTDHHDWVVSEEDYFQAVSDAVWYQDDPVADPSAIPLYLVSKMASEYVKVVLSGEGADELFGGYRIYQEPEALRHFQWMRPALKNRLHNFVRKSPDFYGRNYLLRGLTSLENRFVGNAKIFTDDVYDILQKNSDYHSFDDAFEWAGKYYDHVRGVDDITRMQFIDMSLWLPGNILAKGDKMSMAHSLELRVPFLDRALFDVARKIPASSRVDKNTTKRIFREAMDGIVPDHVLNRPKLGFPVPLREWLKGNRGDMCLSLIESSGISKYIRVDYAEKLVRDHQAGKQDHSRKIWALYVLAKWHILYLENEGIQTAFSHREAFSLKRSELLEEELPVDSALG